MSTLQSLITPITHNIPGFKCYTLLIYDFNITHSECLKYAISKGLGLGIVLGGAIVKIPQIIKIVGTKSARGLSLPAFILETGAYAISLAYASRNHFPFSTYGENLFLTVQNVIITLLILYFSAPGGATVSRKPLTESAGRGSVGKVVSGLAIAATTGVVLSSDILCPPGMLQLLQAATLPLSLLSKAPQIITNYQNHSTGNLSAFAVFNGLLGCLARLFTTKQEVNDSLIFWGFAAAGLLNAVLAIQMVLYWKGSQVVEAKSALRRMSAKEEGEAEVSPVRVGTEDNGIPGRKWARKLD